MLKTIRLNVFVIIIGLASISQEINASELFTTEEFTFESSGLKLNGIISLPTKVPVESLLIIVHSYGSTNVVKGNWFYGWRSMFTKHGIAVVVWDKPGCGNSEGEFNIHQSVNSSATEVVDAVKYIQSNQVLGYKRIGLKGGSRAGWIAPLAINELADDIKFWISISGTDAYETWGYMLSSSLEIAGHSKQEIESLYQEWINGIKVIMNRGTYSEYSEATQALRQNKTYQKLTGEEYKPHLKGSANYEKEKERFKQLQKSYLSENYEYDKVSGLKIYVQDFEAILSSIKIPVLAIFGDNDRHVDWRKTKALYESTMGKDKNSRLKIKVFEGADHALKISETGGYFEVSKPGYWDLPFADGYHQSIIDFLCDNKFCSKP